MQSINLTELYIRGTSKYIQYKDVLFDFIEKEDVKEHNPGQENKCIS